MSLKFTEDILGTENPFVDLLMYNLKVLAFNSVIKDEFQANNYETKESAKAGELYIDCKENKATIELFDLIPDSILIKAGLPQEQIDLYKNSGNDIFYIPKDTVWNPDTGLYEPSGTHYEEKLKPLLQDWYIKKYERNHFEGEQNDYYRKIIGIPPKGEWGIPMREYEYLLPEGFTYEGSYVHEIGTDACKTLDRLGIIDLMKIEYPEAEYLNYICAGITPYDARKKLDFQILYAPSEIDLSYDNTELNPLTFRSMIQEFEDKYAQNRDFMMTAVYSTSMEIGSEYYHTFMIIYTLLVTIFDILSEIQTHIVKKDILNRRCVEYIYSMYGIPFYRSIPEKFHERLVKNLHKLIKYKSSTTEIENIKEIFEEESINFYKYYLLRVRNQDAEGEFIYNTSEKLVCSENTIIENKVCTETVGNPPPPQPVPENVGWYDKYQKDDTVDAYYADGTYKVVNDTSEQNINVIGDAIDNDEENARLSDENYKSSVAREADYIERYVIYPFDYFLQKGNVMFVRIGDYILKEGIDYTIFNYNKIRIKKSLMTNPNDIITYDFYYDKTTVDQDFAVDKKHALRTITRRWDNAKKGQVFDLNPIPWTAYMIRMNDIIVSVNSVWLAPSMYEIDYDKGTFIIDANKVNYVGREVYAIMMYSPFLKSKFEKRAVIATRRGQSKFMVPDPFPYYTLNGNTFFLTMGNVFVNRERYQIGTSTEENGSFIQFTDGTKVAEGRALIFNFLYSKNAILRKINLLSKTYKLVCDHHYQTEFPIDFPVDHYAACDYCVFIKYLGWYLPLTEFSFNDNKITILDQALALKEGDELEVTCWYTDLDRTKVENSNVLVTKDFVTAKEDKQKVFKDIECPVMHYNTKFNKVVIDVNGYVLLESYYELEYAPDGKTFNLTIKEYDVRPKIGEKIHITFIYNGDAEYVIQMDTQQIPLTSPDQKQFSIDFPFYPYLQTGADIIVIIGQTMVAKSRIKWINQFTIEISDTENDIVPGKTLTILYIYNSYYKLNNSNKLIVEWKDIQIENGTEFISGSGIDVPVPFQYYIENGWNYFTSYRNRTYLHDDKYDVFNNTFYTNPVADLYNYKYGDIITFTFIYLIREPYVYKEKSEDFERDFTLQFCRVPVNDLYSTGYLKDKSNWKSYDSIVLKDGWWDGEYYREDSHNWIKNQIARQKWNYARTKYYTIIQEMDLTEYSIIVGYFYSMLYDAVLLEKNLTVEIPSLSTDHPFNLAHLFIFMTTLTYIYNDMDDFEIDRDPTQKYAVGFNFKENLENMMEFCRVNHLQPEHYPIWSMIIPTEQIPNITEFMKIFKTDLDVLKIINKGMAQAESFTIYKFWRHFSNKLLQWDFDMSYFNLPNGKPATTYNQFLQYHDPVLYGYIEKIKAIKNKETQTDMIIQYVDDIIYILEKYIDKEFTKYIFNRFPGQSAVDKMRYMRLMIEFFKSYKIVFLTSTQKSTIGGNGDENEDSIFRGYDEIRIRELTNHREYYPVLEVFNSKEHDHYIDKDVWLREDFNITKKIKE